MSLVSLIFGVINLMHFVWNMHTHYRYTYISSCDKKRCITDLSKCKENCLLPINGEMCYTTLWPLCMVTWKQGAVYKKSQGPLVFLWIVFAQQILFLLSDVFVRGGGSQVWHCRNLHGHTCTGNLFQTCLREVQFHAPSVFGRSRSFLFFLAH